MLKNFEEYINESLWKSGINRSKSGEERLEDKIHSNIKELKPVIFSDSYTYAFADKDFEIEGKTEFTWDEVEELKPHFEKHGWRLIREDEVMQTLMKNQKFSFCVGGKDMQDQGFKNKDTNETVFFTPQNIDVRNIVCRYWTEFDKKYDDNKKLKNFLFKDTANTFNISVYSQFKVTMRFVNKNSHYKIRLIKDI